MQGGIESFDIGDWNPESPPQWSYIDPNSRLLGLSYSMQGAQQCWARGTPERYVANVQLTCARSQGVLRVTTAQGSCRQNWTLPTPLACPAAVEQRSIFIADQ